MRNCGNAVSSGFVIAIFTLVLSKSRIRRFLVFRDAVRDC